MRPAITTRGSPSLQATLLGLAVAGSWAGLASGPVRASAPAADRPARDRQRSDSEETVLRRKESDLLAALSGSDEIALQLRQEIGADARTLQTDHFLLVHNADPKAARELTARLETIYRANLALVRGLRVPARRPPHKLAVLLFRTHAQFRAYQRRVATPDDDILGFFDADRNVSAFFDLGGYTPMADPSRDLMSSAPVGPIERQRQRAERRNRVENLLARIVQHEAAHQIHANLGIMPAGSAPTWLTEGLAELFEPPALAHGESLELSTNCYRLGEFVRLHGQTDTLAADLRRIIVDDDQWRGGPDYCLGWALTDFLYKRRREDLAQYCRHLPEAAVTGVPTPGARLAEFEQVFGPLDEEFVADLRGFLRRLAARCPGRSPGAPP